MAARALRCPLRVVTQARDRQLVAASMSAAAVVRAAAAGEAADRFGLGVVTAWYFVALAVLVSSALVLARRLVETPADDRAADLVQLPLEPQPTEFAATA